MTTTHVPLTSIQAAIAERITRAVADGRAWTPNGGYYMFFDEVGQKWVGNVGEGTLVREDFDGQMPAPGEAPNWQFGTPDRVKAAELAALWEVCPDLRQYLTVRGDVDLLINEVKSALAQGRILHQTGMTVFTFRSADASEFVSAACGYPDPALWEITYERQLTPEAVTELAGRPAALTLSAVEAAQWAQGMYAFAGKNPPSRKFPIRTYADASGRGFDHERATRAIGMGR